MPRERVESLRMLAVRKLWTVLVGAWVGAWIARAILEWLLDLHGTWVAVAILCAAALGGALSIGEARQVEPMDPAERHDTILGWGAVIGAVATVACLFVPMPWGAVAAATVLAVTVLGLRLVPGPQVGGAPDRQHDRDAGDRADRTIGMES